MEWWWVGGGRGRGGASAIWSRPGEGAVLALYGGRTGCGMVSRSMVMASRAAQQKCRVVTADTGGVADPLGGSLRRAPGKSQETTSTGNDYTQLDKLCTLVLLPSSTWLSASSSALSGILFSVGAKKRSATYREHYDREH